MKRATLCGTILSLSIWPTLALAADNTVEKLLESMPADVGVVFIVERPSRALPPALIEPLLKSILPEDTSTKELFDAIRKIPGPFVIGMVPSRGDDFLPDEGAIFAMAVERPDLTFEDWFEKQFFPAIQSTMTPRSRERTHLERSDSAIRIVEKPDDKTILCLAVKNKVAFGAAKVNRVLRWRRDEYPKKSWLGKPGVRSMIRSLPKDANVRMLVNPQAFIDLIPKPKPGSWDDTVLNVLAPSEIEVVACDFTWEKRTIRFRIEARLAEECKGIARILTTPPTESKQIGIFPDDFAVIGRIGWTSAQGVVDHLFSISDLFDKTIAQEYREDLATFEKDTGVNWDGDLLGRLVGEAVIGLRVDFSRPNPIGWAAVMPLSDHAAFAAQLDQLVSHFQLPVKTEEKDGITIHSGGESTPFVFAAARDAFIVSDSAETIVELSKRGGRTNDEPSGGNMRRAYKQIARPNQLALLLDVETLAKKAPMIPLVVGPKLGPLLMQGTASVGLSSKGRRSVLEIVWDMGRSVPLHAEHRKDEGVDEGMITLVEVATDALSQARKEAQRVVSMSNMRVIGQAIYIYAADHKGVFPENLEEILRAQPNLATLDTFRCPYDGTGPASFDELTQKSYLLYRPGLTDKSPPDEILLAEKSTYGNNGANFLFVDGHVEFIPEPRAGELIELMRSGAASVTR